MIRRTCIFSLIFLCFSYGICYPTPSRAEELNNDNGASLVSDLFLQAEKNLFEGNNLEAIKQFDQIINTYIHNTNNEREIEFYIAVAMFNKSKILIELDNQKEALKLLDHLIKKYDNKSDEEIQYVVARATFFKMLIVLEDKSIKQQLKEIMEFLDKYQNTQNGAIKYVVLDAMGLATTALNALGEHKKALNLSDTAMLYININPKLFHSYQAVIARYGKVMSLYFLDREKEALDEYELIFKDYKSSEDQEIQDLLNNDITFP